MARLESPSEKPMAETPEERKARLKAQLDKGRATRAANIATRKAEAVMPAHPIVEDEELPSMRPILAPSEDGAETEGSSGRDERRLRLLEGIDPAIADLISDAELDDIEAEERGKAEAERKKRALASVRESLRQKARVENDLIAADVLLSDEEKRRRAEPVTFKIDLPDEGSGHRGRNGMRVDGFLYQQGQTYTRPRAVAESLRSNHYQTWMSEIRFSTLNQSKRGKTAVEIAGHLIPPFEVAV